MTISYPLSLPTARGLERFQPYALSAVAVLRSPWTFATQVQKHPGDLWAVEAGVAPCLRPEAEEWAAFLISLQGPYGTFLMGDPNGKTPRGTAPGSPKVSLAGQTGYVLGTKDWTASQTGILKKGDYIQISNRLYKVMADANSDALGNCNLDIWPKIRESPALNAAITTSNCVGLFRLDTAEVPPFESDKEKVYTISFTAVEAV